MFIFLTPLALFLKHLDTFLRLNILRNFASKVNKVSQINP